MGKNVAVIGLGYVGLPVAVRATEAGFDVTGFDVDDRKIEALASGRTYIDDITDEMVAATSATGRFRATSAAADVAGFDIAVITVPTPLRDGAPDTSFIEGAARTVGEALRPGATVVLESTTYPGTTEELLAPILEDISGLRAGDDFHLGFSPERIDPGNTTWTFERTPKIVAGVDDPSTKTIEAFYAELVDEVVVASGTREAEMAKLLENTFRHVNIALVNELAIHADSLGIDIWEVIRTASSKPFGFMPFRPGPGVGGHCLPIDPTYLSWQFERRLGTVSRFVKIANDINDNMPAYVARRVQARLNDLRKPVNGSRILILGLAYKANSNDARETPATGLIRALLDLGAEVSAHDAWVDAYELDSVIERVDLTEESLERADLVVLVTDHQDVDYDLVLRAAPAILDTRNHLAGENVETL